MAALAGPTGLGLPTSPQWSTRSTGEDRGVPSMHRGPHLPVGRIAAAACTVFGVFAIAIVGTGPSASAATPTPVCSAAGTCTVTFSTPGTGQSWTVPTGISSASFKLFGAIGGSAGGAAGGAGAEVTGTLSLTAGPTVPVEAGGG